MGRPRPKTSKRIVIELPESVELTFELPKVRKRLKLIKEISESDLQNIDAADEATALDAMGSSLPYFAGLMGACWATEPKLETVRTGDLGEWGEELLDELVDGWGLTMAQIMFIGERLMSHLTATMGTAEGVGRVLGNGERREEQGSTTSPG